jgi:hypothetical protein
VVEGKENERERERERGREKEKNPGTPPISSSTSHSDRPTDRRSVKLPGSLLPAARDAMEPPHAEEAAAGAGGGGGGGEGDRESPGTGLEGTYSAFAYSLLVASRSPGSACGRADLRWDSGVRD